LIIGDLRQIGLEPGSIENIGQHGLERIKNAELSRRHGLKIALFDRLLPTQLQVLVEPGIHHLARHLVVVVVELGIDLRIDEIGSVIEAINLFELREPLLLEVDRPVIGARHGLRLGSEEGRKGDVVKADSQVIAILADAAPCMAVETMTAGNATVGRGSSAQSMNVCVPPPLAPVTPIRFESTSGSDTRKSRARIELKVCNPMKSCKRSIASTSVNPSGCAIF